MKKNEINYFDNPIKDTLVFDVEVVGEIGGVRIIKSEELVHFYSRGGVFGQYLIESDFDDEKDEFPDPMDTIFVDEWGWSSEIREFIILHEYGHYINNHKKIIEENFGTGFAYAVERYNNKNDLISKLELEADLYAASIIGKDVAIKALEIMVDVMNEEFENYDSSELEMRISHLKECE